jgi:hypothetical protein
MDTFKTGKIDATINSSIAKYLGASAYDDAQAEAGCDDCEE